MRLLALCLIASILLIAAPRAADAAAPVRGVTYSALDQSFTFVVSRDGRRAYDFLGTLPGTCPGDAGEVPTRLSTGKRGATKIAGGRLSISESGALRDDDAFFATGSFGTAGRFTGKASYASADACNSSASFTAVAQPRQAGTGRRAYPLLDLTDEPTVNVASMGGGAIAVSQTEDNETAGRVQRIDRNGRSRTLVRFRRERDVPGDIARLRDGSLVIAQPGRNRILRRATNGKLTVAASGLVRPDLVAASPDGGFTYADGGRVDQIEQTVSASTRVSRVDRAGKRTTLATLPAVDGLAVQRDGSVLFSSGGQIRRIAPGGMVSVVAGSGMLRFSGDNGPAAKAGMDPGDISTLPGGGFLFVDDTVRTLRQVSASGRITTYAGGGEISSGVSGTSAAIDPRSVEVLADGSVAVSQPTEVTLLPAARNRRLLVGLPERDEVYAQLLRRRRSIPVRLTRRARVRFTVDRGNRTVGRFTRTLPAGTHRVRLPRALRGDDVSVKARAGRAVAEAF